MDTLSAAFGLPIGFSDHTLGIHIAVAAVARGACLIEKHFTLDRAMDGPDHRASLEPVELREMVRAIRETEQALGNGIKMASQAEWKNRGVARRSLVAARRISKGEEFTAENVACKRPGFGRSPFDFWSLCGQCASRDYLPDEPI
jgi:N-acetylneuraminate synthase